MITTTNEDIDVKNLLEYIYNMTYDNYDNIMKNEKINKILDIKTNMCKKIRTEEADLTDKEIQCKSFTLLYMLMLISFSQQ